MKFVLLLAFLFMWLANPITGGKLFPGFNNPEKWMKRVIRKLQRKTSAYGIMIASNTANISNTAGFISSIAKCESPSINDPDNGLSCCFEDNLNKGQCLCNGMTIDDTSNPGSCCMANQEHPDHCLCSGTDMDDPTNPGNCCFANSGQRLCTGNYTDVPSKRCFNLDWKGDGICDDQNNHGGCNFDGGDCCGDNVDTDLCTQCQCLEEEAPLPNAVGCCYKNQTNPQECLCTGTEIDDPDTPGSCCLDDVDIPGNCTECDGYKVENHPTQCLCTGSNIDDPNTPESCCMDDVDNPGNCFQCDDLTTCNGNGTCIGNTGKCDCNSGFTGEHCDIATCPGKPICSDKGTCPEGGMVCQCNEVNENLNTACVDWTMLNDHVNNLKDSLIKAIPEWTIEIDHGPWDGHLTIDNYNVRQWCAPQGQWFAYNGGSGVGTVSTKLHKSTRCGKIDFGNCWDYGFVRAYFDDILIGEAPKNKLNKVVEFPILKDGELKLRDERSIGLEEKHSVIMFTKFEMVECTN